MKVFMNWEYTNFRFTKVIVDIVFKVNDSYGTSWELLLANDAGTFPISFNDDEVDRVLRCEVFTTLSFFFSLSFSFVSYFTVYQTDCTTKSVTNGATGGMPGCRDNSYGSSGGIFYMDAIIVVKGIRLSVLTGRCAGQSASDVFLNPLSLASRSIDFHHRAAVSDPARGTNDTIIDSFTLGHENCPLSFFLVVGKLDSLTSLRAHAENRLGCPVIMTLSHTSTSDVTSVTSIRRSLLDSRWRQCYSNNALKKIMCDTLKFYIRPIINFCMNILYIFRSSSHPIFTCVEKNREIGPREGYVALIFIYW